MGIKSLKEIFEPLNKAAVAFLVKGSPDPDSIASSLALLQYYQSIGGEGAIYHEDYVSHSSNKTMINILDIKLQEKKLSEIEEAFYVVCDHTSSIIEKIKSKCILHVDHHKEHKDLEGNLAQDDCVHIVEYDAGSCSSIITRLLNEIDFFDSGEGSISQIATALMYGIRTDTDNFDSARAKDFESMKILSLYYNQDSLKKITRSRISTQTADVLKKALQSEKSEQNWLYAGVGFLQESYRDSIASAADEMIRRTGVDHVLVYAVIEKSGEALVEGSVRSVDPGFDLEGFVKHFSNNAGARKYKGGFQIPLGFWSSCPNQEMLEEFVRNTIESKLKTILGTNTKKKGKKEE